MTFWTAELYEDAGGKTPVKIWFDDLSEVKFAAMDTAIRQVLQVQGIDLARTHWLTPLGEGLWEFRVRDTAAEILRMYSDAHEEPGRNPEKILLRLFVHFYGQRIVLLLHGYDKSANDAARNQQREISLAGKRLKAWKLDEARKAKQSRRQR